MQKGTISFFEASVQSPRIMFRENNLKGYADYIPLMKKGLQKLSIHLLVTRAGTSS